MTAPIPSVEVGTLGVMWQTPDGTYHTKTYPGEPFPATWKKAEALGAVFGRAWAFEVTSSYYNPESVIPHKEQNN